MSESTVSALLAPGALLVVVVAVGVVLLVADPRAGRTHDLVVAAGHWPALLVAATAMGASLYYSEIADFIPCEYCWYQRIAMYPLALILAIAVVTRGVLQARYAIVPALIGLGLSIYHYQLQLNPEQSSSCSGGASPCTAQWVEEMGFVSIPFMAGCGFAAILLWYAAQWRAARVLDAERAAL